MKEMSFKSGVKGCTSLDDVSNDVCYSGHMMMTTGLTDGPWRCPADPTLRRSSSASASEPTLAARTGARAGRSSWRPVERRTLAHPDTSPRQ